jgi:hypothetical protein
LAQPTEPEQKKLYIVELNKNNKNFVNELRLDVSAGDSIQFKSTDGDFAIYIIDAISFLKIDEPDLKTRVNTSTPESEIYIVSKPTNISEEIYSISVYCITTNSWPDAPPRIIIVSQ